MSSPVEFSSFFKLLHSIKEGGEGNIAELNEILNQFKTGDKAEGFLQELGQLYLYVGIQKLYQYTNQSDIKYIGSIEKEEWVTLAEKNDSELPQFLAKEMIEHVRENKIVKSMAGKWNVREREINKHTTKMARYVTEGLIDVLE